MNFRARRASLALVSIVLGFVISAVNVTFAEDSGYTPLGVHMGSFYLYPVAEVGLEYDDNVFRLSDEIEDEADALGRESGADTILRLNAAITANSDWNRHALNGFASLKLGRYNEFKRQDFENYTLGGDGRLDIKRGSYATGRIGVRKRNESRSSVNGHVGGGGDPLAYGVEPTQIHTKYVGAGYDYRPARLGFSFDLDYRTLDYSNVDNVFGGVIDNSDRDRSVPHAIARISYEVMPQRRVYVEGRVDRVDYDQEFDQNGIERSSSGYKVTGGMSFDLTNLLVGDVFAGYLEQNYDSPTQADISSNLWGAHLQWFPSRLTSVNFGLDSNVEESTDRTVSGYLRTTARVGVIHELKRNIILSANADHTQNKFKQNEPGRKELETITGFDLEGRYLISRRLYTALRFRHEYRESDIKIQEYNNNRALLTLGANW